MVRCLPLVSARGCDSEIQGDEFSADRLQAPLHRLAADRRRQNNRGLPAILHSQANSGQPFQFES